MNLYAYPSLFNFTICLFLGTYVLAQNFKYALNREFFYYSILIGITNLIEYKGQSAFDPEVALFWLKFGYIWPFIIIFQYRFLMILIGNEKILKNFFLNIIIYLPAILFFTFSIFFTTNYLNAIKNYWGWSLTLTYSYVIDKLIIYLWFIGLTVFNIYFIIRYIKKTENKFLKKRTKYLLVGLLIPIIIGSINHGILVRIDRYVPLLNSFSNILSTVIFCIVILKYQLFEITPQYAAKHIIDSIKDGLILINSKGEITAVNNALIKMLQISQSETIGMPLSIFVKKGLIRKQIADRILNGEEISNEQYIIKKYNLHINFTCAKVDNKNHSINGTVCILNDITEIIMAKNELQRQYDWLKETQAQLIQSEKLASLGQLAAGVAHEINNPLGYIKSNLSTLQDYIGVLKNISTAIYENENKFNMLDEAQKNKLKYVLPNIVDIFKENQDGINRIETIVRGLKDFAYVDKNYIFSKYDLNDAIKNTVVIVNNELKYLANIKLNLGNIPKIECNINEIKQVLLNIILNAIQAIESQARKEKGLIQITTYFQNTNVTCEIEDDGPGIAKKTLSKIFDPFFTTKECGKGTGMGLNISYDIVVNKHKGKINVKSELGKGTTFIIVLPKTKKL